MSSISDAAASATASDAAFSATAALLGLAHKVAKSLRQGRLTQMVIQGVENDLVISSGKGDAVLAVVLQKGATLGVVAVEVQLRWQGKAAVVGNLSRYWIEGGARQT